MKAFETHVTGIKRTAVPEHSQQMKEFDEVYDLTVLDQQLQKADIVIRCLPGTPETKGLLNYERLHSMKKAAILVNVGRRKSHSNRSSAQSTGGRPLKRSDPGCI